MKANELRIGNYLSGSKNEVRVVKEINEKYYIDESGLSTLLRDAKPIPLTQEWLLKFQFGKKDIDGTICFAIQLPLFGGYSFINIMHSDGGTYVHLTQMDFGDTINNIIELDYKIEYVHQLQNLYFALTGQEL